LEDNTPIFAQSAGRTFFGNKKQQKIQCQSNNQGAVAIPGIQLQQQGQLHFLKNPRKYCILETIGRKFYY
jgi:hypothetical protein